MQFGTFFSHYVEFHSNVFFAMNTVLNHFMTNPLWTLNTDIQNTQHLYLGTIAIETNIIWYTYANERIVFVFYVLVRSLAVHKSILEHSNKIESMIFEPPTKLRELHIPSWRLIIIRNNADLKFTFFFFFLFFSFFSVVVVYSISSSLIALNTSRIYLGKWEKKPTNGKRQRARVKL